MLLTVKVCLIFLQGNDKIVHIPAPMNIIFSKHVLNKNFFCDLGVVYDFQGPYSIGKRTSASMAFGPVTRVVCVDVSQIGKQID